MKKLYTIPALAITAALTLSACGGANYSDADMDPRNQSVYNNELFCGDDDNIYVPVGDTFYCEMEKDGKKHKTKKTKQSTVKKATPAPAPAPAKPKTTNTQPKKSFWGGSSNTNKKSSGWGFGSSSKSSWGGKRK